MASLFNLVTDPSAIQQSNFGISKDAYEQQAPTRDVSGPAFANGQISFRWSTAGTKYWVPSRTYLRARIRLTNESNSVAQLVDDIAPTMAQFASLFSSMEFRINSKTVSRVGDFCPQVDAFDTRINKSKAWLDGVGASTNHWSPYFHVRQCDVAADSLRTAGNGPQSVYMNVLGIPDGTTLDILTNGDATLSAGPNTNTIFKMGDVIRFDSGAGWNTYTVAAVFGSRGMTLAGPCEAFSGTPPIYRIREENIARRAMEYEITWTPRALSIFKVEHAIPCGQFELVLTPQTASVWKIASCESSGRVAQLPVTNYDINVVDMFLYIATCEGERVENLTYYLDLESTSVQAESLRGQQAFGQKAMDVPPSTKQLGVAFQDTRAGTDTRFSCTKFLSYNNDVVDDKIDQGLTLNRLFLQYASQSKPAPDADPAYNVSQNVNRTTQRYYETQLACGGADDPTSGESISDWRLRGPIYLFNWSRDGNDRSTRVSVHTGFTTVNASDLDTTRLLLFAVSSQICKVVIQNNTVTDVVVEDV